MGLKVACIKIKAEQTFATFAVALLTYIANEQAASENESKQTIWSIVNHLIFWNVQWLERFNTEKFLINSTFNNDETFYLEPDSINENRWKETLERLQKVFSNWRKALEECDESKFSTEIPAYFNAPWWGVVSNLCIHNAYHIGQIMLLKKQIRDK
ncbi:DinB family protein [Paenibacillus macerans]|uniref:DinB family protein n=1 Tax=Paenibacillus macerans TaxID=44252 RepID=UPI003D319784